MLATGSVALAARRDVGSSTVPDHDRAGPRLRLLAGPLGLTVRLVRPAVVAWAAAIAAGGMLYGLLSHDAAESITGTSVRADLHPAGRDRAQG